MLIFIMPMFFKGPARSEFWRWPHWRGPVDIGIIVNWSILSATVSCKNGHCLPQSMHTACIKELLSPMRRSILHRCAVFYGHGLSAFGFIMCALLPAFALRPPIYVASYAGMTCSGIVSALYFFAFRARCNSACLRRRVGAAFRRVGLHLDFSGD